LRRDPVDPPQGPETALRKDDHRGVVSEHAEKLRDILVRLDASASVADMDLPGFRLDALKGELTGFWAVTVRANWRVIFRLAEGDAFDVDYLDYP
jgi:toxin HigB-1